MVHNLCCAPLTNGVDLYTIKINIYTTIRHEECCNLCIDYLIYLCTHHFLFLMLYKSLYIDKLRYTFYLSLVRTWIHNKSTYWLDNIKLCPRVYIYYIHFFNIIYIIRTYIYKEIVIMVEIKDARPMHECLYKTQTHKNIDKMWSWFDD